SAIFYTSDAQKAAAEKSKAAAQKNFKDPIVTEITKTGPFYKAEDYHQEYFNNNSDQGYCRLIIAPKLDKLKLPETPTTAGNGTAK
ncbi:MAG TPA: peptide-methionine (S)-S-oxide reductase, partial [Opitutales bacterium]|nr:peptide-methionine (S)-S-oxide reductase [Opitutales bacterium]